MNIYNFLQVGKLVVGNLFKYLLSQEVKSYLSQVKYSLLCWKKNESHDELKEYSQLQSASKVFMKQ